MTDTFNSYQYKDFENKENEQYAYTKYKLILGYLKKTGKNNLNILNAGCGSGDLSILLASAGHNVIGIDPDPKYISLAKERASKKSIGNYDFRVQSIKDLPASEKYDCVIASDVLEHIDGDYSAMKKLSEATKENGLIIISVPALEGLFGFHDSEIGHYRRYSKRTLKRLVESPKNINILKIRYFGFTLIPVCYLFSCWLRRAYPYMSTNRAGIRTRLQNFILDILLFFDSSIPMPLGTSLICVAKKYSSNH